MPKVDVKIVPIQRFKTYVNGKDVGEFEVESTWEGFIKLKGEGGVITGIVGTDPSLVGFPGLFREVFGSAFSDDFAGGKEVNFEAVQITSDLIPIRGEG